MTLQKDTFKQIYAYITHMYVYIVIHILRWLGGSYRGGECG